jgi:methyl-accepting chemotaxis protein
MITWTVGRRIVAGFAIVLLIAAAIGGFALNRISVIDRATKAVTDRALRSAILFGTIESLVKENFINTTQHINETDEAAMKEIEKEMAAKSETLTALYKELEPLLVSAEAKQKYELIKPQRIAYRDMRAKVLALSSKDEKASAQTWLNTQLLPIFGNYTKTLQNSLKTNREEAATAAAEAAECIRQTRIVIPSGTLLAIIVGAALSYLIARMINRVLWAVSNEVHEGAAQVAQAATQVNAASQSLAQGTSEQAASLEETSASLEEITSMTSRNAESAATAKTLANLTRTAAEAGSGDMQTMTSAMDAIKTSSDAIAKIIKTIDEIAFQTNILALNAAVEAARAGEAGAGFAVVAEEVRALAQRCAQAARETTASIEDSIHKAENGVEISGKVAVALQQIVENARKVDELIAEIATASKEQSQGLNQIVTAVAQMDKVTQSLAAGSEESAASAQEMHGQAMSLEHAIGQLDALVGSQRTTTAEAPHGAALSTPPVHVAARTAHGTAHRPEPTSTARP